MTQLPAFFAATLGESLLLELTLLIGFVIILNVRRLLNTALSRYERI